MSSSSPARCPTSTASACSPTASDVCEAEIKFWHGAGQRAVRALSVHAQRPRGRPRRSRAPLEHGTGRGAARPAAPPGALAGSDAAKAPAKPETSDGYVGVLGLIAHEYFHAWNVKRLKPREFATLDYARENYTELLWFFEGFTSYYDDLMLAAQRPDRRAALPEAAGDDDLGRAGVAGSRGAERRRGELRRLGQVLPRRREHAQRDHQLLRQGLAGRARARPDAALGRHRARSTTSCAGSGRCSDGGPIDEADIAAALESVGGRSYERELAAWVHGTDELPLAPLLQRFGVEIEPQPATLAQRLGVRVSESALTGVKLTHVLRGGAGELAGLAPGDEIIAIAGWRVRRLDDALRALPAEGETALVVGRDQRLLTLPLVVASLAGAEAGALQLKPIEKTDAETRRRYEAWTGG